MLIGSSKKEEENRNRPLPPRQTKPKEKERNQTRLLGGDCKKITHTHVDVPPPPPPQFYTNKIIGVVQILIGVWDPMMVGTFQDAPLCAPSWEHKWGGTKEEEEDICGGSVSCLGECVCVCV